MNLYISCIDISILSCLTVLPSITDSINIIIMNE